METRHSESQAELERVERYLAGDQGNTLLIGKAIDLCLSLGRIDAAREHADAALRLAPGDLFVRHLHGHVLMAQGHLDEAAETFEALLAQVKDVNIAYNLALARHRQQRFADARAALEPFVKEGCLVAQAASLYLRTLHHLGEFPEALEFIQRQMPHCGRDAEFLSAASLLLFDNNQLEEARRMSDAALANGARPLEALVVAGSLALARDDPEAAVALLREALAIQPADGRSWAGLGMASLLGGDLAGAQVHLERAAANLPSHIGTLHALGWCHILRRDLAQAEQIFSKALALDRNFGETHGGLAVVQALQGRKSEAEEGAQRALRLDPQCLSAKYAQMVLSGVVNDPVKFRAIVLRLATARGGPERDALVGALTKRLR